MLDKTTRPYRLGLDLGSNSLGWFVVDLEKRGDRFEPVRLGPGGVRIFPDGRDPQSKASNAVDRRMARGARKRRDRFVQRRGDLMAALIAHGLMPKDTAARKALEGLDPYALRKNAIKDALPADHIGRALFHLNQRRGFQSNRKTDGKEKEDGAIKQAASHLDTEMKNESAKTLGAFLAGRHLRDSYDERQTAIRAELVRLGKDHLTGNARKKIWAKVRKRLYGDDVLPPQQAPDGVRARAVITGAKASYDFYPTRDMLKDEFAKIWETQAAHHPAMTHAARDEIYQIIFFQRPLKPAIVGKCTLDPASRPIAEDPEGYRAPWSHPLAQRFRILQEARNLEVREGNGGSRRLTIHESDRIVRVLLSQNEVKFDKIRKELKLSSDAQFNLESEKRDKLKGDETSARLANTKAFGNRWRNFPLERQIEIVDRLQETENEKEIVDWLMAECGLNQIEAMCVANTSLPDGHCRYGLRAIRKINPIMEKELADDGFSGVRLYDAARRADPNYDTAQAPDGVLSSTGYLPYYGEWLQDDVVGTADPQDGIEKRYGRFPNPTVHIGLGQVRRVVNELIRDLGAPTEISIEFTRSLKMSLEEKAEKQRDQARNQRKNEERKAKIRDVFGESYDPTPNDLLRMRLWEELGASDSVDRKCPYTGESIGIKRLLSSAVEIDHILPFSMTWDDSAANKTVCMQEANRLKKKQTPFQAFGSSPGEYDWNAIRARAALLPKNKRWRFDEDAQVKFDEKGGFQARQLNETGWLARLAKKYLAAVTDPNQIWVVPGRLTSMIRGKWALNSLLPDHNYAGVKDKDTSFAAATDDLEFSGVKNRADHRHHAIDGLVAALTDRSLLLRMAIAHDHERDKIKIPTPWDKDQFRSELEAKLKRMVVSHKPDHGIEGQLHEDTAYGLVKQPDKEGDKFFVRRKPIENLSAKEVGNIRDERLRAMVQAHIADEKTRGVDIKGALLSFKTTAPDDPHIKHGLNSVRVLVAEDPAYTVSIASRQTGKPYKAYAAGENLFVDIYETAKGKWAGKAVTRFQANQTRGAKVPFSGDGTPVMRVFKGDLIALDHKGVRTIMVVRQLEASNNRFKLCPHNETGNLQARHDTDNDIDPFRWLIASYNALKSLNAVPVRVDGLGRVWRIQPH